MVVFCALSASSEGKQDGGSSDAENFRADYRGVLYILQIQLLQQVKSHGL